MKTSTAFVTIPSTISDVERDTGLAKETLRVWERRYDFPRPERDTFGERVYPSEQVIKLRLIKRLIDLGHRPGKVIGYSADELQALAQKSSTSLRDEAALPHPELQAYLELCKAHQMEAFRRKLTQAMLVMGLKNFVINLVAPLTTLVGEAWACGQFAVFEEHLFAESVQIVLRSAVFSVPQVNHSSGAPRPRVLLTTLPQERHGLGLLMAEAIFAAEGAHCIPLGVQTPLPDIVEGARAMQADIIALSFFATMNPRHVNDSLRELRARLPEQAEIWAGGSNSALRKRAPSCVTVCELTAISAAVIEWRQRQRQALS
ncbi:MerR family transcriptional regulator [Duganella sp. Root1480D1]|uniref:MerR family transcriptional regulator n=1 Tax=Duganella sp. Root1480D1 TaxID=1736471 RepID=UPI00070BA4B0|nr:MerR family transcriptional regulator [Duganella sp. Root1480D1]KQZ39923.1 cobalamin-binding protein [Duganella sp. Root1480D1]